MYKISISWNKMRHYVSNQHIVDFGPHVHLKTYAICIWSCCIQCSTYYIDVAFIHWLSKSWIFLWIFLYCITEITLKYCSLWLLNLTLCSLFCIYFLRQCYYIQKIDHRIIHWKDAFYILKYSFTNLTLPILKYFWYSDFGSWYSFICIVPCFVFNLPEILNSRISFFSIYAQFYIDAWKISVAQSGHAQ